MPILDLFNERAPRPPVIGRIRLGIFDKGRPQAADSLVFTSKDRAMVDSLAASVGGEVEEYVPQRSQETEYRLVSESDTLDCYFPFPGGEDNFSQDYELWGRSGIKRRCDGFTATVNSVDEETGEVTTDEESCVCKAQQNMECAATTRLRFFLPQTPGLGVWELSTTSKFALYDLHDLMTFLQARFEGRMHKVPMRLAYLPKTIQYVDQKDGKRRTTTTRTLSLNLAQPYLEVVAMLDGNDSARALAAPHVELPPGEPQPSDEGPVAEAEREPSLPAGQSPSSDSGVEGEVVSPSSGSDAAEPSTPLAGGDFIQTIKDAAPQGQSGRAMNIALLLAKRMYGVTNLADVTRFDDQQALVEAVIEKIWEDR